MHEYMYKEYTKQLTHISWTVCNRIFFNIFVRAKGYNIIHTKRHQTR